MRLIRNPHSCFILLIVFLLPFSVSTAQEAALPAPPPESTVHPPLTLKGALDLALKNSSQVAIGIKKMEEKVIQTYEKQSAFLPQLSLGITDMDATKNLKAQGISFPGVPDKIGPFSTFDTRLSLNETLLNVASLNRYHTAQEEALAAGLDLNVTRNDILFQAALFYFTALRAEASVKAEKANLDLSEELLSFAQHQKEAGITTLLDVTRAQVKVAEDRQKWISAVALRDNSLLALQKQIGLVQGEDLTLSNDGVPEHPFPDIKESILVALNNRKELQLQTQREKVKEMEYRAVRGEKYPNLQLFADYGEIGNGITDAFPTYTVGLTLNLPLYDGKNRASREAAIESQLLQEKVRHKDLALQVELDVRQLYNDLNAAGKEFETAKERLSLTEKELKLAEHRFETGIGDHIELVTAQTSVAQGREALVEAQYFLQAAILKYYYVTGQMEALLQQTH